jgi:hypothetical protein
VRHAVVLIAVVDIAHLPAFLYCGGADDGAESHGERDDDHGEWFHHLDGLSVCVVRAGELSFWRCQEAGGCGQKLVFG